MSILVRNYSLSNVWFTRRYVFVSGAVKGPRNKFIKLPVDSSDLNLVAKRFVNYGKKMLIGNNWTWMNQAGNCFMIK